MKKLFLILCIPLCAFARLDQDGDFQIWERTDITVRLPDHWKITVVDELRWGNNALNSIINMPKSYLYTNILLDGLLPLTDKNSIIIVMKDPHPL